MFDYNLNKIIKVIKDIFVGKRGNFTDALFALADAIKSIKDYEHEED